MAASRYDVLTKPGGPALTWALLAFSAAFVLITGFGAGAVACWAGKKDCNDFDRAETATVRADDAQARADKLKLAQAKIVTYLSAIADAQNKLSASERNAEFVGRYKQAPVLGGLINGYDRSLKPLIRRYGRVLETTAPSTPRRSSPCDLAGWRTGGSAHACETGPVGLKGHPVLRVGVRRRHLAP